MHPLVRTRQDTKASTLRSFTIQQRSRHRQALESRQQHHSKLHPRDWQWILICSSCLHIHMLPNGNILIIILVFKYQSQRWQAMKNFKKSKQLLFAKKVVQSPQCVTIGHFFSYDLREASLSRNMNHNIQIDTQVKFLKYEEKLLTWMHEFKNWSFRRLFCQFETYKSIIYYVNLSEKCKLGQLKLFFHD